MKNLYKHCSCHAHYITTYASCYTVYCLYCLLSTVSVHCTLYSIPINVIRKIVPAEFPPKKCLVVCT